MSLQKEIIEIRKENALLKKDIDKLTRKLESRDEYMSKFRDLKIEHKQLLDSFEQSEIMRREQKVVINEYKKQIITLKKKVKKYKEK